ncbi:hypothetical protein EA004_24700, partial [Vibrio anguillarum]|nr:hypothetical protein [Vibrio anguillarum]
MLYKYRADNQYTEMIFTTGKVHLSVASALNDPFECNLKEIGSDWIKQEVQEMKKAALAGFVMNASQSIDSKSFSYGVSHKKLAKVIKKMASKGSIDEQYKYFRQFMRKSTGYEPSNTDRFFSNINSQLERVGIFSLAES